MVIFFEMNFRLSFCGQVLERQFQVQVLGFSRNERSFDVIKLFVQKERVSCKFLYVVLILSKLRIDNIALNDSQFVLEQAEKWVYALEKQLVIRIFSGIFDKNENMLIVLTL